MFDPREFRNALGQFATGVTIVTTLDTAGAPIGVTANSFSSVSLEPPLVLWSLARQSYSLPAFEAAGHFAIHVLGADQRALSDRFARAGNDKFADLDIRAGLGGVPLLRHCAAVFECSVEHRYAGGDHVILVGRVQRFETASADPTPPLLFHRGRYADYPLGEAAPA